MRRIRQDMDASSSASTPSPCSGTALCRLLLHTRKEARGCCTELCRVGWCGEDISSGRPPDSSVIGAESKFGSGAEKPSIFLNL